MGQYLRGDCFFNKEGDGPRDLHKINCFKIPRPSLILLRTWGLDRIGLVICRHSSTMEWTSCETRRTCVCTFGSRDFQGSSGKRCRSTAKGPWSRPRSQTESASSCAAHKMHAASNSVRWRMEASRSGAATASSPEGVAHSMADQGCLETHSASSRVPAIGRHRIAQMNNWCMCMHGYKYFRLEQTSLKNQRCASTRLTRLRTSLRRFLRLGSRPLE